MIISSLRQVFLITSHMITNHSELHLSAVKFWQTGLTDIN